MLVYRWATTPLQQFTHVLAHSTAVRVVVGVQAQRQAASDRATAMELRRRETQLALAETNAMLASRKHMLQAAAIGTSLYAQGWVCSFQKTLWIYLFCICGGRCNFGHSDCPHWHSCFMGD